MRRNIFLISLLVLVILAMGFNGCPSAPTAKSGIDFSLKQSLETVYSGKTIGQEEPFYVLLEIKNYDKIQRTGKACIRDDQDSVYGGISGEECTTFSVKAAEVIEEGKKTTFGSAGEKLQPGTTEVYFPASGEYAYSALPITQRAKLFISLQYLQSSRIESSVAVPEPTTELLELKQSAAPISVSAEKSITRKEDAYKATLGVDLTKQQKATILSPDFVEEGVLQFKAEMPPKSLECTPEGTYNKELLLKGLIEIENKKFIKCSTLIYEEEQATWPLILTLSYGVRLEKEFPFMIKAE